MNEKLCNFIKCDEWRKLTFGMGFLTLFGRFSKFCWLAGAIVIHMLYTKAASAESGLLKDKMQCKLVQ